MHAAVSTEGHRCRLTARTTTTTMEDRVRVARVWTASLRGSWRTLQLTLSGNDGRNAKHNEARWRATASTVREQNATLIDWIVFILTTKNNERHHPTTRGTRNHNITASSARPLEPRVGDSGTEDRKRRWKICSKRLWNHCATAMGNQLIWNYII